MIGGGKLFSKNNTTIRGTLMGKATIKIIAEKAGVSIGTVDRALNNRGRISAETKTRILQIAESLGYRPNHLASALRRRLSARIALIMPKFPHYFMDELLVGIESVSNDLEDFDVELEYFFSNTLSPDEQIPILEKLDVSAYDAIAINAGSDALVPYINHFVDNGIPVVTFNSDVANSKRSFYVGENSYSSGRIAGELMGKMLRGHGTVAIFAGFSNINSHFERANGFRDYLNERYPAIEVIDVYEYHDQETEACSAMWQLLEKHPAIHGIFCVSAVGALGVGTCLREVSKPEEICLIGYDVNYRSAQLLLDGYCSALMYQDPRNQSRTALLSLSNMLSGKWTPEQSFYYTKTKIVVGENLNDYARDILEKKICD